MSKHFGYHDNWENEELECPTCGWKGTFKEGAVELYKELMDSSCPHCDKILAIVSYPILYPNFEAAERNWDNLPERERKLLSEWKSSLLKSASQLPELDCDSITLEW